MPPTPRAVRPIGRTSFSSKRSALPASEKSITLWAPSVRSASISTSPSSRVIADVPPFWTFENSLSGTFFTTPRAVAKKTKCSRAKSLSSVRRKASRAAFLAFAGRSCGPGSEYLPEDPEHSSCSRSCCSSSRGALLPSQACPTRSVLSARSAHRSIRAACRLIQNTSLYISFKRYMIKKNGRRYLNEIT